MQLNPQIILESLRPVSPCKRVLVAYSGGLDSHVLLDLCHKALLSGHIKSLQAVHVNHQLNDKSDNWVEHCQHICKVLEIPLTVLTVSVTNLDKGIEAGARDARYQALQSMMQQSDVVLTAHHQRDQVETFLLQLSRGSGLAGLASMPVQKQLGPGFLVRPLLTTSYEALSQHAKENHLQYIEDSSNQDISFDRNFIRHEILPKLQTRWPKVEQNIAKATEYLSEHLAWEQAEVLVDMQNVAKKGVLFLAKLALLSQPRQTACLRHWFRQHLGNFPTTKQLQTIYNDVIAAAVDKTPQLVVNGYVITRYKDELHCFLQDEPLMLANITWDGQSEIILPSDLGMINIKDSVGSGVAKHWLESKKATIRFRQGGEKCRLPGRSTKPLKKLLQEAEVPPWLRNRIPLLYLDDTLAAVIGFWVCEGFEASTDEPGLILSQHLENA